MHKDLLTVEDVTIRDLERIFALSSKMKKERTEFKGKPLSGKSVALMFSKNSTRTRVSFEVGISELGGFAIYLDQKNTQLGRGESISDTARVLSRYVHAVVIRTYRHGEVVEFAKHANIPVINALTDEFHPCQILADMFTIYEYSRDLGNVKLAYLGDCSSNVASSLILAAKLGGFGLTLSSPPSYGPSKSIMESGNMGKGSVSWIQDPAEAVRGADYLYTDVWVSMGCEEEKEKRLKAFAPYRISADTVACAGAGVKIMHCLPAHRGQEIADEVMDSHNSIVFDQAENRLHVQKAILSMLLSGD